MKLKSLIKYSAVVLIFASAISISALRAEAHGIVEDGHDGPLRPIDYIELGGVALGSVAMIIYSLDQWRKDKKKKSGK